MVHIDIDFDEAYDRTIDYLQTATDEISVELAKSIAAFFYKAEEIVDAINAKFE